MSNQKGQLLIFIIFFAVIILGLGFGWFYLRDQAAFGGLNLPFLNFLNPTPTFSTTGWKQFTTADQGLNLLYPPSWYLTQNQYLSQYPYTPGTTSNDVYNVISVKLATFQLQTSYANQDWVDKVYNSKDGDQLYNEYHSSDQVILTKVSSGKTLKGDKFVLFTDQNSGQMQAYLAINPSQIYQFTLDHYDQNGLNYYKQIIETATTN